MNPKEIFLRAGIAGSIATSNGIYLDGFKYTVPSDSSLYTQFGFHSVFDGSEFRLPNQIETPQPNEPPFEGARTWDTGMIDGHEFTLASELPEIEVSSINSRKIGDIFRVIGIDMNAPVRFEVRLLDQPMEDGYNFGLNDRVILSMGGHNDILLLSCLPVNGTEVCPLYITEAAIQREGALYMRNGYDNARQRFGDMLFSLLLYQFAVSREALGLTVQQPRTSLIAETAIAAGLEFPFRAVDIEFPSLRAS